MNLRSKSKTFVLAWCALALFSERAESSTPSGEWSVASPDRRCEVFVSLNGEGELRYQVRRDGDQVILESPLGVVREDQAFLGQLVLDNAGKTEQRREAYPLFAGVKPKVDTLLNRRSLCFRNEGGARIVLDLAASNEGVAFRYRFPESNSVVRVISSEATGFALPSNALAWLQPYHVAGPYTPAYEDFYFNVPVGVAPPDSRAKASGWSFPALFEVAKEKTWALITESGTDAGYCGCHLNPDASGGMYRIAFARPDQVTKGQTYSVGPEPRSSLPWTLPWRVVVIGTPGEIAVSTLVTDLAPPSQIQDTSWIRPGRASWAWWAYPDGPNTKEVFNKFTDFGAEMEWEYTLFDAGWWEPGLSALTDHARSKGVTPMAWLFAGDFYDSGKAAKKLDEMTAAGIRGVKVDFWCSDRQESIAAMQNLFQAAAARRLLVNLHGCTIPRGWQRTWPNFLAAEAVLGTECYFYEPRYTEKAAELNTVLPFTRNVAGPMDSTPVACSPKKYARTTTAAHELATAVVFTSGLIHYADSPEFFRSLPVNALKMLREAPARWDETKCLAGEPGKLVIFARRAGEDWYVAGLNGTSEARRVDLNLSEFRKYARRLLVSEAEDSRMQVVVTNVPSSKRWVHTLPPRGGFILHLR